MIEEFKCAHCRKKYEVTWDDWDTDSFIDEDLDEIDNSVVTDEDYTEPEHCPFCGKHLIYDEVEDE